MPCEGEVAAGGFRGALGLIRGDAACRGPARRLGSRSCAPLAPPSPLNPVFALNPFQAQRRERPPEAGRGLVGPVQGFRPWSRAPPGRASRS